MNWSNISATRAEVQENTKTRRDVPKTCFHSLNQSCSNSTVCRLFELMPRWVSRVCSALCCSDCFMFPFPELFLHCTVKIKGSKLGLIVNKVKQDIEVWPLNPHWASSEWHTWLGEVNGGGGGGVTHSVGTAQQSSAGLRSQRPNMFSLDVSQQGDKRVKTTCQSGGVQRDRKTLWAGNDSQEAAAPPACVWDGLCLTPADRAQGEGLR